MQRAALEFSDDTLDVGRREAMAEASRSLLLAVTRLLVVVDAIDSHSPCQTSVVVNFLLHSTSFSLSFFLLCRWRLN